MYTKKVMDHFTNPRNMGEIDHADGVVQLEMQNAEILCAST